MAIHIAGELVTPLITKFDNGSLDELELHTKNLP